MVFLWIMKRLKPFFFNFGGFDTHFNKKLRTPELTQFKTSSVIKKYAVEQLKFCLKTTITSLATAEWSFKDRHEALGRTDRLQFTRKGTSGDHMKNTVLSLSPDRAQKKNQKDQITSVIQKYEQLTSSVLTTKRDNLSSKRTMRHSSSYQPRQNP